MTTFYFEGVLYIYYPEETRHLCSDLCDFSKECNNMDDNLFCIYYNFPKSRVPGGYYKRTAIGTLLEDLK